MNVRAGWLGAIGCLTVLVTLCSSLSLHAADPKLPDGWQQLSADAFAAVIRPMFEDDSFQDLTIAEKDAAKERGKQLFLQVDLTGGAINYPTLEMLQWLARYELDSTETNRAADALVARQDDWTNRPYAEMRAKVATMLRLQVDQATLINEARKWVAAGGTIDKVPPADFAFPQVRQIFTDAKFVSGSFDVVWTGMLTAPAAGEYTFFLSPININAGHNLDPVAFRMTISVDGQTILDSSPDLPATLAVPGYQPTNKFPNWANQSQSVILTANQQVPIKVTATARVTGQLPTSTLHALLYWQGPGIAKALLPTAQLAHPENGQPGLKAVYTWSDKGQPQSVTRTDPMIDFAWSSSTIPLPQDQGIANSAADTMWQTVSAQSFINTLLGPPVKLHPFLSNPDAAAAGLSTTRRGEFLAMLLQNPSLLDSVNLKNAVRLYQAFRFGNSDQALEVFGKWATRHPDIVGDITTDRVFMGDERFACASLAINTTQQLPDQIGRLQSEYLQLTDGRCSLPVAYTLGCSYLGKRKYKDWLAILDAKLADSAVTGDTRVNWLIARANASELYPTSAGHYPMNYSVPFLNPRDGRKYLDQALEAAQSPEVKIRVAKEIVNRLVWERQIAKAKEVLQPLVNGLPDEQKAIVAGWQQQLNDLDTAEQQDQQTQATEAKKAYLKSLQARRDKAAAGDDTATAQRYDALINAATENP